MNHSSTDAATTALMGVGFVIMSVFFLGLMIIGLVCNWRIVSKAGYSGVLSLLALVPFVGFILIIVFAFAKWPIEEQLEAARRQPLSSQTV